MSQEYNFKDVKKELSRTWMLDRMRKDVLDELPQNIWEQIVEREVNKLQLKTKETESVRKDLQWKEGSHLRQDSKWEEISRNFVENGDLSDSKKKLIFRRWEQRMTEIDW